MALDPTNTPEGKLPPFEVAKALAFEAVITQIEKHTQKSCWELMGMGKAEFTANQLQVSGGGHPTFRQCGSIKEAESLGSSRAWYSKLP